MARSGRAPKRSDVLDCWKTRKGGRAAPVLLVVLHPDGAAALCGPAGEPPPVLHVYTVRAGDTVQSVADEFGIGAEYVVWNNDDIAYLDDTLEEGTLLRIPGVEGIVHRVAPGETLSLIAERYGANVGSIVNFASNGLSNPNLLHVGTAILVPGARLDTPVTAPTPEPTPVADEVADEDDSGSE